LLSTLSQGMQRRGSPLKFENKNVIFTKSKDG